MSSFLASRRFGRNLKKSIANQAMEPAMISSVKGERPLDALHRENRPLLVPNAWDAGTARRVVVAGARIVATTSAGVAWANGYADGEQMPEAHLVAHIASMVRAVSTPISVDIETGYSDDPERVASLVERLADIGVVGINIEDGVSDAEHLVRKLSAIRANPACNQVFVNARTDVYLRELVNVDARVSEVCRRTALFAAAGADGLFVPGLVDPQHIRAIAQTSTLPLNVMAIPGMPKLDELRALGVRRVSAGPWLAQYVYASLERAALEFLNTGSVDRIATACTSFATLDRG